MHTLSTTEFGKLSISMCYQYLVKFGRDIEDFWEREKETTEKLHLLADYAKILLTKDDLREAHLFERLATQISYHHGLKHFLTTMVPIERVHSRPLADHEIMQERDSKVAKSNKIPLYLILDNIRSAFNVGSMLRTSECLGVTEIFLTGYTATPDQLKTMRAAMGADKLIKWQYRASSLEAIKLLENRNIPTVAVETSNNSISCYEYEFPKPVALILGNERYGLSPDVLHKVSEVVNIPMAGRKNSLNVGVACGILGFEISRQWQL